MRQRWRRIVATGLCGPVAVTLVSLLLLYDVSSTPTLGVQAGAYGPLSWPLFSLSLLVAGTGLLCALRARTYLAPLQDRTERRTPAGGLRVLWATLLIALYGAAFVYAGFLFGTIAFLAAWLVFTHYRRPFHVALISVLGTLLPLFLLIKVAYMPLPRGVGVFEQATIQIYQWLHLF